MKMDSKKIIIIVVAVLVLAIVLFLGIKMLGNKGPSGMPQGQGGPGRNMNGQPPTGQNGNNIPTNNNTAAPSGQAPSQEQAPATETTAQ